MGGKVGNATYKHKVPALTAIKCGDPAALAVVLRSVHQTHDADQGSFAELLSLLQLRDVDSAASRLRRRVGGSCLLRRGDRDAPQIRAHVQAPAAQPVPRLGVGAEGSPCTTPPRSSSHLPEPAPRGGPSAVRPREETHPCGAPRGALRAQMRRRRPSRGPALAPPGLAW